MRPLVITTPIYYVNDVPHIGHAYTTIAADVLARHHRNFGRTVFFLTGTDEHGLKVQKAAAERGIEPKKHCDETVERFMSLWKRLNISNDCFIRTTDPEHIRHVQAALDDLMKKNEIYEGEYEGSYCVPCEQYWTDKDLVEGNCPSCRRQVVKLTEKNYFFRMKNRLDQLVDKINAGELKIIPEERKNEVLGSLRSPHPDMCISRAKNRLAWGIPLPFDRDFVTYVWFDALLNYPSSLTYAPRLTGNRPPAWDESEVIHFIGKDILIPAHSIYWPTMLMAMGLSLPKIVAHGWWTVEGQKMSKSLGNVVDPNEVVQTHGVDAFRYFLLREVPFGLDGDFSIASMVGRINHDLADEFGNLVGRICALVRQKENGVLNLESYQSDSPDGIRFKVLAESRQATESFQFSVALTSLFGLFARLNKKINDERPWESAEDVRRKTLATCAVDLARGIFLLSAYTPALADEAVKRLGCGEWFKQGPKILEDDAVKSAGAWKVTTGEPLVKKVETKSEEKPVAKATADGAQPQGPAAEPGGIDITDFQKVDLRTARILAAERISGSDKLLRLSVVMGGAEEDKREIVAGIGKRYEPDQLIGKTVVVVANLKPRKVFGVESCGMILAAGDETTLHVLTVDGEIQAGIRVK